MNIKTTLCLVVYIICILTISSASAEGKDTFKTKWDGAYIGAVLGKSTLKSTTIDSNGYSGVPNHPKGYEFDYEDSGTIGGLLAGYNIKFGNWVTGIEGDFSVGDLHASSFDFDNTKDEKVESEIHWLATLRGRVGYSFGRFLPYLTAGLAYADITDKLTDYDGVAPPFVDPGDSYSSRKLRAGWVVGGGAEYLLSESWLLRLEAMYVDLGRVDNTIQNGNTSFGQRSKIETVRLGLAYHF